MRERPTFPVAVYLIVMNPKKEVLLLKRKNTWYCDWFYSLVAWHKEKWENVIDALIREWKEEANIDVDPNNLKFVWVMNRKIWNIEYIEYFYLLENYTWNIENNESHKCEHLKFFMLNKLPNNIIDYIEYALLNINTKNYSLLYWW